MSPRLMALVDALVEDRFGEVRSSSNRIIDDPGASDYERALAFSMAANAAYALGDNAASKSLARKAVELNALGNTTHFQMMFFLSQLQMADQQYADALLTLDRYFSESASKNPDDLVLRGMALFHEKRFQDAASVIKRAIDTSPRPKDSWMTLLAASYLETGQKPEAIRLSERVAAGSPCDKRAQTTLASMYAQDDRYLEAANVLEKLRPYGLLNEQGDYRLLYLTYTHIDGKDEQVIAVVNEGLGRGLIKPDYEVYLALAQSYYFTGRIQQSISAYEKAAPLAPTGGTYRNLSRLLRQEGRITEAEQAERAASIKDAAGIGEGSKSASVRSPGRRNTSTPQLEEKCRVALGLVKPEADLVQEESNQARKGLLGALIGAVAGAAAVKSYGGSAEQVLGGALKGAAIANPDSAAVQSLGSLGETMLVGNSGGSTRPVGNTGGGSNGYAPRPNLAISACAGFTESNYRQKAVSGGGDQQLYTMCGQAFEYYTMYKRAIAQGYSEADANRTYAAHQQSAEVAASYLRSHGAD